MALAIPVHEVVERSNSPLLSVHDTWDRVLLHEVAEVQNGFAFPSSQFSNGEDGVPLIRIRDILNSTTEATFTGDYEDAYIVPAGDLLVGMDGDFNSARWRGPKGLLNQRVCRVTVDPCHYDLAFLAFTLPGYLDAINEFTSSITVKHLSSRSVEQIPLPLPPLTEQRRIVAAIEEQFSRLDTGVATLERVRTNLKRYRTAVLKAAVEGRLTEDWREENPNVEPASELLERILRERRERWEKDQFAAYEKKGKKPPKNWRSKYKEPAGPKTEDLSELPKGWIWSTLEQLAWSSGYGTSQKCGYEAPGPPVLRIPNVAAGAFDLTDLKFASRPAEFESVDPLAPNDMLIIRTNGSRNLIGRGSVVRSDFEQPYYFASYLIRFRLVDLPTLSDWLVTAWDATSTRGHIEQVAATSAGQYNVNISKLSSIPVPLPPLAEQEQIVAEVERPLSILQEVEAEVEANLMRAARLRQAILKRAFEGKLVPQDPTDEPSSELLARIRTAREQSTPAKRRKKGPAPEEPAEAQPGLF